MSCKVPSEFIECLRMKHKYFLRVSPVGRIIRLLILMFALMIPTAAPAETHWNFTYTVKSNNTIDITGYTGIEDEVTIPNAIKGLPVTGIGKTAFYKCHGLASVIIPESVTSIGERAFGDCSSLLRITVPAGVTSIGKEAFFGCGLIHIIIPENATSIGEEAFSGCTKLTSVTIPSNVTDLGKGAFAGCTSLTNVTFQGAIAAIGDSVFSGCTQLTGVTIPDSVTSIGSWSFSSCRNLINVIIPGNVTHIGDRAFYKCTGLTGIYFQGNAPAVGSDAFLYNSTATIYYLKGTKGWNTLFGGRPTKWWKPQAQTNVAGTSAINRSFEVMEASGVWAPLQTNTPTGGSVQFGAPQSTDDQSFRINMQPLK